MAALHLQPRLIERRVEDRPEMDEPPEENEPEQSRELDNRDQQSPLEQLPKTGNEETTQRRDHIARGTLPRHENNLSVEKALRNLTLARKND